MPIHLRIRNKLAKISLRTHDFGVVREIFGARCYAHKDWIEQSRSFLDLGANEGIFTLFALSSDTRNKAIAIEAQAKLAEHLNKNLEINDYANRCKVHCGYVGNINQQIKGLVDATNSVDLKKIIDASNRIDFLKVDIEGSEFDLFRESPEWVRNIRFIAMEVHPRAGDVKELIEQLSCVGFRVSKYKQHNSLGYLFLENVAASSRVDA